MPGPRVRLLASGDLHLGRYPSRVPPGDPALTVESVLRALVDQAIERRVDAVLLAGDLADASNKHFEAFGVLERALHRLSDAAIPTFAVAGDHDFDVLGAIADAVGSEHVRVLGRGECWERAVIEKGGQPALCVAGWSFAGPHVHASPLADFPGAGVPGAGEPAETSDVPTVGLLHADLGADAGAYAPVALRDLAGADAWVLGHGHAARVESAGEALVLVPGSPQPLGPEEAGPHGAWLLEVGGGERPEATPVPLASIRYDTVTADLDGARDAEAVRERIARALRQHAEAVREGSPALRRAVVRLTLKGRTPAFRGVAAVVADMEEAGETALGGLTLTLDGVDDLTRPDLDLDALAAGSGPAATLAALARRLEQGEPAPADLRLIRQGVEALQQARQARVFEPLARDRRLPDDLEAEAVRRLRRQAYRLLDEALEQRPSDAALPAHAGDSRGDGFSLPEPPGLSSEPPPDP